MKLTKAQVDVLNNGERNTTYPGKVWMSPWNDKTIGILRGYELIEEKLLISPHGPEFLAKTQELDRLADVIKTQTVNENWVLVRNAAYKATAISQELLAKGFFLTEAGRQALLAANGGV